MQGIVEVFQIKDGCWDKTYEDSNVVVHGGKAACADIFTHLPFQSEDGISMAGSAVQSVSNYTIQSITLGAGTRTMTKRDSRHGVVKNNDLDGNGSTQLHQYLDVSGKYYSILPYRENFDLDAFGKRGRHKNPAEARDSRTVHPDFLSRDVDILKYYSIVVSESDEDGGSYTFEKIRGQDFATLEVPIELHLNTEYKIILGVDGTLPVK